jgi:hypothetical protein
MSKHTPEPWETDYESWPAYIQAATLSEEGDKEWVANCGDNKANASRIVACINACAGMGDPQAEIASLKAREAEMRAALVIIVNAPSRIMHDERQQEVVCYWPGDNPNKIAARALIARESAEPAEERGPEVGDIVMYRNRPDGQWHLWEYASCGSGIAKYVVLMRRAEVEARMKGEGK